MGTSTVVTGPETTLLRLASGNGPVKRRILCTPLRDALSTEIPVIDISLAFSMSLADRMSVAQQVRNASTTCGFFYLTNHGIDPCITDSAFAACLDYFRQDNDTKMRSWVGKSRYFNGYKPPGSLRINKSESVDIRESFSWSYDPRYDPDVKNVRAIPDEARQFLRMEDFHWDGTSSTPFFKAAIIRYWQSFSNPQVSIGSHTDFQLFTILWQDAAGGLQVLNHEGQWIRAAPIPGTLVVNIADYMQRITNDLYVSTVHRAQNFSGSERISMPFFFGFGLHESCGVIDTCVKHGDVPKYSEIACEQWVQRRAQSMHTVESDDENEG
ncbi:2OG-Fe(II) oxygenase superfamily protein [Colletotrichum graminicola M1.001]|uniref:2OG-Fe(II) oxygenase superfamily protein n=1 Tax=Colletotrichum graminicola (strain M1.001 / M2 / FGSC 10212) TaxID=645133 RepID=E3QPK7_COLGM|nr:2OG-Fe(II) oxygenase superfamily protein [Colletotrichum graminicola M1.001]EFQ32784.1 2OG-Fe(II) oxygenase superfamily protein [Colletotrichum graminicola M1.001]